MGGAQIHVRDLAARLQSDGLIPLVLVGNSGPFTADLDARGVRWRVCPGLARSINPFRDLRAVREVHRALLTARPLLISTHTAKAGLVGRLAAAWMRIPVVFTAHGWQFAPGIPPAQRMLVYALELLLARLPGSSRVITVSRFDYRLARGSAAVSSGRLRLVYNGLPDETDSGGVRASDAASGPIPLRFVMVARFQAQKDHATLLHALAEIPGPWTLQLVGEEGPRSPVVRDLARRLGFFCVTGAAGAPSRPRDDRTVELLGHRGDVAALLGEADIYCLVTNWEGLPRSIIEAMRAGLPVVATGVGGVKELVVNGVTGRVVPRGDAAELADALRALVQDRRVRERMGREGRRRYEERFTFETMYHNTRAVWCELGF